MPGAGLVCLSVLLTQMQVPLAGIGLVMGMDSLLGMMRAMSNSLGDVAASPRSLQNTEKNNWIWKNNMERSREEE